MKSFILYTLIALLPQPYRTIAYVIIALIFISIAILYFKGKRKLKLRKEQEERERATQQSSVLNEVKEPLIK